MHVRDLVEIGKREHGVQLSGKTPANTLNACIINERKRREHKRLPQRFVRVARARWGLAEYVGKYYDVEPELGN